jgi:ABC-type amino acid transport system permease subunit
LWGIGKKTGLAQSRQSAKIKALSNVLLRIFRVFASLREIFFGSGAAVSVESSARAELDLENTKHLRILVLFQAT